MRKQNFWSVFAGGITIVANTFGSMTIAQDGPSYTVFGTPGLIEMPTAESAERSDIAATFAYVGPGNYQTAFNYQLTPNLFGSFRYSMFDMHDKDEGGANFETPKRSFDLHYRFNNETQYIPAVAVGLRDFLGTGSSGSEYLVASKSFGPNLIVTGGLGWGRLGSNDVFSNPLGVISSYFDTRPVYNNSDANGGTLSVDQFFRGDAALFGGLEYQVSTKLGMKLEYSSIDYSKEPIPHTVDVSSPFNFGLTYRPKPNLEVNAGYLYGSDFSIGVTLLLNPETRPVYSGLDRAPAPVRVRLHDARASVTWDRANAPALQVALTQLLAVEGIVLDGLEITDLRARVRFTNNRFRSEAQAIGRVARMMSQVMPESVETFVFEPMQRGIAMSATTLLRSDIEKLENTVGASAAILNRAKFNNAGLKNGLVAPASQSDKWQWGIGPYVELVPSKTSGTSKIDVGLQFEGQYEFTRNLVLSGSVTQSALGKRTGNTFRGSDDDSVNVRTDGAYFGRDGAPRLENLILGYHGRIAPNVYSRVTFGLLERMYGGVSTELLWKPVDSRLAIGAEVNYIALRNRDVGLAFDEYDYQVATGHLSAYYDLGKGFKGQVDVGKYLAGDWGGTFILDREFQNGWRVGGYFTLTDMPFDDFGEGSFDKGIRVTIPYDYFLGSPSRKDVSKTLHALSRDGGARIKIDQRLYETVRTGHAADMSDTWGRFWR